MSMRFVVFARTVHLHGCAAVGAILLCFAVVLNVGPFAKAPAAVGRQAAPATMEQPNESGMAQRDLNAQEHTRATDMASIPLQRSQSAEQSDELPDGIRALIQPSPFLVAEASPVLQPFNPHSGGDGIAQYDLGRAAPAAQPDFDDANATRPAIVGIWAPDAGTCSARDFRDGMLPTVINAEGAWAGETFCMFTTKRQTELGWSVIAKCSSPRERWTSNVHLSVSNDRMTWKSKRGTQTYTRCAPDVLMAQAR